MHTANSGGEVGGGGGGVVLVGGSGGVAACGISRWHHHDACIEYTTRGAVGTRMRNATRMSEARAWAESVRR